MPSFLERIPEVRAPVSGSVSLLLADIERHALETYAAHGLPTSPGQYAKGPGAREWKFISESLSAEARWSLALENGSTAGWKFKALEDLGASGDDQSGALARASEMLRTCRALEASLKTTVSPSLADDIERALRLGADWQQSRLTSDRRNAGSLSFKSATTTKRVRSSVSKPPGSIRPQ